EVGDRVAGFMLYDLHKGEIHILRMAVAPSFRRTGVGRSMVEKLIGKLHLERRSRLRLEVRETNLDAQLFYRACGLQATAILHSYYMLTDEDAYQMERCVVAHTHLNNRVYLGVL